MKTAKDFLDEANAVVPKLSTEDAIALHQEGGAVFVDVRDSGQIATSGTVAGAERITRGMIEFMADETHPLHNASMQKDAKVALICAAGGQAALAGKTLVDMGYTDVVNVGGFPAWKDAGGPSEAG
ncbi:MAG: rhodanese-like domain-containing protein [Pseudomonadota bacterium]